MSDADAAAWPTTSADPAASGDPTRDERVAMQEHDDGARDDTVFVSRSGNRYSYHDDPACVNQRDNDPVEQSRAAAQRRWLAPCRACILTTDGGDGDE